MKINVREILERVRQIIENEKTLLYESHFCPKSGKVEDTEVVADLNALADATFDLERVGIVFDQLQTAKANAVLQAQVWAGEARTQQTTVHEIYQAIGYQGGDWNGARPVVEKFARLRELLERSLTGLEWYASTHPESASEADNEHLAECRRELQQCPSLDEVLDAVGFNPFKPLTQPLDQENEEQ